MYKVKSHSGTEGYMDILKEKKDGYDVRITIRSEYKDTIEEQFLSRDLFDMCLRTGYIQKQSPELATV